MNSPFVAIYNAIRTRFEANLTDSESRYIDLELGQMESYDPNKPGSKPPVSFPAQLIDFETTNYTDLGAVTQRAEVVILIRICFQQISATNNITPNASRELGLQYFDIEWKINKLLHGWSPGDGYEYLMRIGAVTEQRPDNYRVRQLRYKLIFKDNSTKPATQLTPTDIEVTGEYHS